MGSNMEYKRRRVPDHGHGAGSLMSQGASGEPLYLNSPAAQINSANLTAIKNLSGTNTGDQDLSDYVKGPASAVAGQAVLFDGTTGKFIKGGKYRTIKTDTTTPSYNGGAWADAGLSFSVLADAVYYFRIFIKVTAVETSPATNKDIFFGLTGPASPTYFRYSAGFSRGASWAVFSSVAYDTSPNYIEFAATASLTGIGVLEGYIMPSSDGTVALRVREGSTFTAYIQPGTFVEWEVLG